MEIPCCSHVVVVVLSESSDVAHKTIVRVGKKEKKTPPIVKHRSAKLSQQLSHSACRTGGIVRLSRV